MRIVALVLVTVSACADEAEPERMGPPYDCVHPPVATYSCEPVPIGTADSCPGHTWAGETYDGDKAFPLKCEVVLPVCLGFYPYPVSCTCDKLSPDSPVQWLCPV